MRMRIENVALAGLVLAAIAAPRVANAGEVVIVVGGDEEKGKAIAEPTGGKYTKKLGKALGIAAEQCAAGGDKTVVVKIAHGDYVGEFDLGSFKNPKGKVTIQGGWSDDFTKRDPFHTPTRIVSPTPRTIPFLQFAAKDEVNAFTLDGLIFDGAPGNKYDAKTNSLLKGESCTFALIRFNNLKVEHLEIANCIFMNSAHRAFETLVLCPDDKAEIKIVNTIFFNCLIPVKLDVARQKHIPAKILVDHCSFITNFAFNPDPDTSNPAALELGGKYAAHEIEISNNLFYANFGGAIMNIEKAQTKVTIKNNNFVGNGLLHGDADPAAAAMIVGKKQPIPVKQIVDEEEDKTLGGNVSIAPGLPVELGNPKAVDASKVKEQKGWENEARRLLGQPIQGGKVAIKDFAPRKEYDPANPPFPTVDEAKKYGASPELVK